MRKDVRSSRKSKEVVYYDSGKVFVSDTTLRTPRKTFRLNRIEKLALRRDPLFFALPICIPLIVFGYGFFEYLYIYEMLIIFCGSALILFLAYNVGILFVESKAVSEPALVSKLSTLREVRIAVEDAMEGRVDEDIELNDSNEE